MDTKAVIIPCYNEEQTIQKVVADYRTALPEAVVYVYDNNSTDRTAALAAEAGAVVRHEPLQGKSNGVRSMLRDIDAACYLILKPEKCPLNRPLHRGEHCSSLLRRGYCCNMILTCQQIADLV